MPDIDIPPEAHQPTSSRPVRNFPARRGAVLAGAAASALAASLALASPASASQPNPQFTVINQVSDQPGHAKLTDPNLVNAWGLALSPTSPLWVANNGTNTATIYTGGLGGTAVGKAGLTVAIPGGAPTGQVFNDDPNAFKVKASGGTAAATFIFDSEGGQLTAWSGPVSGTNATVVARVPNAIFKGLSLWHTTVGTFLLATDFHNGRVDVFDSKFHLVPLPNFFFHDPSLPSGYAPFNVLASGDTVYVTYALQGKTRTDEVDGAGLGFVDAYTNFGTTVKRIASRGTLNAPWGLAIAPTGFGSFTGALLVGNFGDGRIGAFTSHFLGALRDSTNHRIQIDGLWALLPGTATTGGVGTLWFSSGPSGENHGLVGQIVPAV